MQLLLSNKEVMSLDEPRVMGILNLTPDSFSDGGRYLDTECAVQHGLAMAKQGADIIDIGGESTRPGSQRVEADEQIRRVVPIVRALRQELDQDYPAVQISIDTTRAAVAEAAVDAGAGILNDVSGGLEDERMLAFAAERGLPIVLMHMRGEPGTMQESPEYGDVVVEVKQFLLERAEAAEQAGVDRRRIVLDPGIGFGKTTEHNLALLRSIDTFVATGYAILVGASRKRFICEVDAGAGAGVADRLGGTCAVTAYCVSAGVQVLRVHDVEPNRQAARLIGAIKRGLSEEI